MAYAVYFVLAREETNSLNSTDGTPVAFFQGLKNFKELNSLKISTKNILMWNVNHSIEILT